MTAQQNLPFERFYNLANLSEAGDEILFTSSREDLARLAHLASIAGVERQPSERHDAGCPRQSAPNGAIKRYGAGGAGG